MRTHLLIGCGRSKLAHPAPARDLYTGSLFRAARGYAESSGLPWAVLSARYGVVQPGTVIEPYDTRLLGGAWPRSREIERPRVGMQIARWIGVSRPALVEIHAGAPYVKWARLGLDLALVHGVELLAPLHGLQVGERLSWYRQRRGA